MERQRSSSRRPLRRNSVRGDVNKKSSRWQDRGNRTISEFCIRVSHGNVPEKKLNRKGAYWSIVLGPWLISTIIGKVPKVEWTGWTKKKKKTRGLKGKHGLFRGDPHIQGGARRIIAATPGIINQMLELEVLLGQITSAKRLQQNRAMVTFVGNKRDLWGTKYSEINTS